MNEKSEDKDISKTKKKSENTNIDAQTEVSAVVDVNVNPFSYLIQRDELPNAFSFSKHNSDNSNEVSENIYKDDSGKYKYVICILLKNDEGSSSELLKNTIDGIKRNFVDLEKLSLKIEEIYIFVFVNQVSRDNLVKKDVIKENLNGENKHKFLKTPFKLNNEEKEIKIDIISKKFYMSDIEALRCFYYYIVKTLKKENQIIITSVITAGVIPKKDGLKKLIQISFSGKNYKNNKKGKNNLDYNYAVAVPSLEVKDNKNFFIKIAQYDRLHFNLYNMNFFCKTAAVPICSLLNTMVIDDKLIKDLMSFYSIIEIDASIDYHDYNLGLYLFRNLDKIYYFSDENLGEISYSFFDLMEYQDNWINRFSGYYGNFFQIINTFTFCNNLPFDHKIFMLFQIIGMIIEFIYPGLSLLVVYSIFIEAFGQSEIYSAAFMTILYLIMYLGSGACSMISSRSREMNSANFFLYIFMEVYYLFILICSIPAMDNIKKGKNISLTPYKFNSAACACLIVFTFIIGILPIIFKIPQVSKNIVQMLIYLFLGAPSSTSNFLIAKIFRAPETSGGQFKEEKKGLTIICFFLSNLFFGSLGFFNYDTKKRANCVMGLAIFYLIYLFFKIIGITFSLLCGTKLNTQIDKNIRKEISNEESDEISNNVGNDDNELKNSTEYLKKSKNEEENNGEEKLDNEDDNNNSNNNSNHEEEANNEDDNNNNDNEDNNNNDNEQNEDNNDSN